MKAQGVVAAVAQRTLLQPAAVAVAACCSVEQMQVNQWQKDGSKTSAKEKENPRANAQTEKTEKMGRGCTRGDGAHHPVTRPNVLEKGVAGFVRK